MHYILRQVVRPHRWRAQLADVIELCRTSGIDEVMLMEQSHQVLTVPFPLATHRQMAGIYQDYALRLRANGIGYSVNLATIVGHHDAPVTGEARLGFTPFVGEDLVPRTAVYCVTDPRWVSYAEEVVALYAATGPRRLMVDDDFRSLNHTVSTGCFCQTHATRTAEALGRAPMSSAELLAAVLADTDDALEVKAAWQAVTFAAQLDAARAIERAVHAVDAAVDVGLMNSGEPAHSLQGRDMAELLAAFAGPGRATLSRPAGGAYADGLHAQIVEMHQLPALSRHAAGDGGVWVSEVENWPHTRYLKSVAVTRLQLALHALWGADAVTLNLYDYLGTPFQLEPHWAELLVAQRPELDRIQAARCGRRLKGVGLPWHPDTARHLRNRTGTVGDLLPRRPLDTLLPLLGVPVQFEMGAVNVLLGDDVLAWPDEDLSRMLAGGLLIDCLAAEHLAGRGWGDVLGGRITGRVDVPVVERLTDPEFAGDYLGCDLPTDWAGVSQRGESISRWQPSPGGRVISTLVNEQDEEVGAALTLAKNAMGGRVAVLAQRVHESGWLHRGRAAQIQAVLSWLAGPAESLPMVAQGPNVAPFIYVGADRLVALVNTGLDSVEVELAVFGVQAALDGTPAPERLQLPPLAMWLGTGSVGP